MWLRGMLEHEYGVPHRDVTWIAELDEDVAFEPHEGLVLEKAPSGKKVEWMLAEGELDAVLHPDLIEPILQEDPRVTRLFDEYKAEEEALEQMARAAAVAGPKAPHGAELSGHESGQTAFHPSAGHGGHHCGDLAVREKVVDVPSGPCRDPTAL